MTFMDKLGVQTFTLRSALKTPEAIEKALMTAHEIGYSNFELARIAFDQATLAVLKKLQDSRGIRYSTMQIKLKVIERDFEDLVAFAKTLGINSIEVSVIPLNHFLKGKQGILDLSKRLNSLGEKCLQNGIKLLYHHHHFEMVRFDGMLSLELLMNHTDARYVNFVCDTYWLARGGFDPFTFVYRHQNRIKGVHLRDIGFDFKRFSFRQPDATIGKGAIDFSRFCTLDHLLSISFYSVEQDAEMPFQAIEESYKTLKHLSQKGGEINAS